jgi:predicted lipoprotein
VSAAPDKSLVLGVLGTLSQAAAALVNADRLGLAVDVNEATDAVRDLIEATRALNSASFRYTQARTAVNLDALNRARARAGHATEACEGGTP